MRRTVRRARCRWCRNACRLAVLPRASRSQGKYLPASRSYTFVGEAPTFLCSGFSAMTDEHASLVLVHEALHRAGLPEGAWKAGGVMSSAAINDMVQVACGLNVAKKGGRAG